MPLTRQQNGPPSEERAKRGVTHFVRGAIKVSEATMDREWIPHSPRTCNSMMTHVNYQGV